MKLWIDLLQTWLFDVHFPSLDQHIIAYDDNGDQGWFLGTDEEMRQLVFLYLDMGGA